MEVCLFVRPCDVCLVVKELIMYISMKIASRDSEITGYIICKKNVPERDNHGIHYCFCSDVIDTL